MNLPQKIASQLRQVTEMTRLSNKDDGLLKSSVVSSTSSYPLRFSQVFPEMRNPHLVGGLNHPEKYEFVNGKAYPIYGK